MVTVLINRIYHDTVQIVVNDKNASSNEKLEALNYVIDIALSCKGYLTTDSDLKMRDCNSNTVFATIRFISGHDLFKFVQMING